MPRLLRIVLLTCAAMLLAACTHGIRIPLLPESTPPPSRTAAMQRLETETPCCHAWADLPFHGPLPPEPRAYSIDSFSPVAVLDGDRTHFLTFVLPPFKHAYRVVFQTRPSARHLGNSFLFAPTVTLLNANYEPITRTDVALCVYINWRPSMSGGFGAVRVADPDARYLVVTTSKKQLEATTYWAQSPTSFSAVKVPSAAALATVRPPTPVTSGSFNVPHGPEGVLYVGRMTPDYAAAVDDGLCGEPEAGQGLLPELQQSFKHRTP